MELVRIIDGCIEGKDWPGVAGAVLAHPFSCRLDQPTIDRFFRIVLGGPVMPIDEAMLSLMGDFIRLQEDWTTRIFEEAQGSC